jgi:hypothetical protein
LDGSALLNWLEAWFQIGLAQASPAQRPFFEHLRTITAYIVFPNWQSLLGAIAKARPP